LYVEERNEGAGDSLGTEREEIEREEEEGGRYEERGQQDEAILIIFQGNKIGSDGIKEIASALSENVVLTTLHLGSTFFKRNFDFYTTL
jgi:hypothetical protein